MLNIHEALIQQCRAGDRDAHFKLYKLYAKAMYNVAYRVTGDPDDANDALQEGFISAFRNLPGYRGDAPFGAWLKRIVINKSINLVENRKTEHLPDGDTWDVPDPEEAEPYHAELSIDRVRRAIESLPDGYRMVLTLYLIEGYDHEEIGQILGITVSTSKSQLNRAKNKLKELLTIQHERSA